MKNPNAGSMGYTLTSSASQVVEKLSICLEYSLIGRFNRMLRCGKASHLASLSIHMAPDDAEDSRMQVFELRRLRLVELSLHHSAFPACRNDVYGMMHDESPLMMHVP
jgi:hypothetical protein